MAHACMVFPFPWPYRTLRAGSGGGKIGAVVFGG